VPVDLNHRRRCAGGLDPAVPRCRSVGEICAGFA
jgi:hypothetical protein